jgi:hypothetical protein
MRADARRNYERLVDGARKVFADRGGGASMEAIAKQAGVGRIDLVEAVYREDVDTLIASAQPGLADLDPWDALEAWPRAYVEYARAKKTFLNELREAFEKNPDLKPAWREREAGAARRDIDATDLMQVVFPMCSTGNLTPVQGERLLMVVLDGLRPPGS